MFVLLMYFTIVYLYLNSVLHCTANANVDRLNQILSHSGWETLKSYEVCYLTDIEYDYETYKIEDVLKTDNGNSVIVDENNFKEKNKKASMALSAIYFDILSPLINNYIGMKSSFQYLPTYDTKVTELVNFDTIILLLDTFITCMIKALEFFNEPTPVLENLKKLKFFYGNLAKNYPDFISFKEVDVQNVEDEIKTLDFFDENFIQFHFNFVSPVSVNSLVHKYIVSITEVSRDGKRHFNPRISLTTKKIQKGIEMFCHNFGFKDQIAPLTF